MIDSILNQQFSWIAQRGSTQASLAFDESLKTVRGRASRQAYSSVVIRNHSNHLLKGIEFHVLSRLRPPLVDVVEDYTGHAPNTSSSSNRKCGVGGQPAREIIGKRLFSADRTGLVVQQPCCGR